MARPIVITGGGTGGHIMPMIAIADALAGRGIEASDVVFVGSRRGQEQRLLGHRAERLILLPGRGLRRSFAPRALWNNLGAVLRIGWSLVRAVSLILTLRPRAVVSVGGYAAFPMVAATSLLTRPRRRLFLVELDATPGLVHRMATPWAAAVLFGIEPLDRGARSHVVGVPLRTSIESIIRQPESIRAAKQQRGISPDALHVVVMTGSLGARRVNDAIVELAAKWSHRDDVVLTHVTGQRDYGSVIERTRDTVGPHYRVVAFEGDMPSLWAATDIAICRAGAATVAELAYLGVPSVLVPLPNAPGDHQTKNAQSLVRRGAALLISDAEVSAERLNDELSPLIYEPARRDQMTRQARVLRRPGAAQRIVSHVLGEWPPHHVHVVGAGGAGMSGVVRYFSELGATVTGSDSSQSAALNSLSSLGRFEVSSNVRDASRADVVTWSPAVPTATDPDLSVSQRHHVSRPDLLALIAGHHTTLAVTGTHGKTTASSMLVHIARAAQWSPSWLVGAEIRGAGANGHYDGDVLVLELDESYGSFQKTTPHGLAILNVEADHLDHYGTLGALEDAFIDVARRVQGPTVLFRDGISDGVAAALSKAVTVGFDEDSQWRIDNVASGANGAQCVVRHGEIAIPIALSVPGHHNLVNAAVVAVLAFLYGASTDEISRGLSNFTGAPRRFEHRGLCDGAVLIDDYAHLPTEVSATLSAARETGAQRILAVFQPHRITRTLALVDDFASAFSSATELIVTDIYHAGEANPTGVTGALVADTVRQKGGPPVTYLDSLSDVRDELLRRGHEFDMIVVMGAGDIAGLVNEIASTS